LIAGYVVFLTAVIVVRGDLLSGDALWLMVAHALLLSLLFLFTRLGSNDRIGSFLHTFYPILLLAGLYSELGILAARRGPDVVFAHDDVVQGWEQSLFGLQVSYEWIRRAPSVFWSGVLHLAYFSYYPIVVLGPLAVWLRGNREGAERVVFATMIAFLVCYAVFVLYPVAGPNWVFEHPTGAVRDVWSAKLVYGVLENGASMGAAFPSSHVAATGVAVLAVGREWRAMAVALALPALLLLIGTVYCQMHYGVDVLAGIAVIGITEAIVRTTRARHAQPES